MTDLKITITADADTLGGLWAEEDGDRADELAQARLDRYLDELERRCRARWPGAEVVRQVDLTISGATPRSRVESQTANGWDLAEDETNYELAAIEQVVWQDACAYEPA